MEAETQHSISVKSWIDENKEEFATIGMFEDSISLVEGHEWTSEDVPEEIHTPGADFFRNPGLVIERKAKTYTQKKDQFIEISEDKLIFDSTMNSSDNQSNGDENIEAIFSVVSNDLPSLSDGRRPGNPIVMKSLNECKLTFLSLIGKVDFVTPIVLQVFLFDTKIGRKVSEPWTFVPPMFQQKLQEIEGYESILKQPQSVIMSLSKPYAGEETLEDDNKDLFIVCLLERPCVKNAGSAINTYYSAPKPANLKKAQEQAKTIPGSWRSVFAYGAIRVSDIAGGLLQFSQVVKTDEICDAYLAHKLSKERKHPHYFPFELCFSVETSWEEPVPRLRSYFPVNPYFKLHWRHELLVSIKSAAVSSFQKKSLGCKVMCFQGGKAQPWFNGFTEARTHCIYHQSTPKFQDDIIMQLPWPPTMNTFLTFMFYSIDEKTGAEEKTCGRITIPLVEDDLILVSGERKIEQVVDQKVNQLISSLVVDLRVRSSTLSSCPIVDKILRKDFTELGNIDYFEIVSKLPLLLDVIMQSIVEGEQTGFMALLSVISVFPANKVDSRYDDNMRRVYDNSDVQPIDHLMFYARYCALRKSDQGAFFDNFVKLWLSLLQEFPVSMERLDLKSIDFLMEIITKCVLLDRSRVNSSELQLIITSLQCAMSICRAQGIGMNDIGRNLNLRLALFYRDLTEIGEIDAFLTFIKTHIQQLELRNSDFDRSCFVDIVSACITPKSFLILCAPRIRDSPASSIMNEMFIPKLEAGLSACEEIHEVFTIFTIICRSYSTKILDIIAPSLRGFIDIYGKNESLIRKQASKYLMFPFAFLLTVMKRIDFHDVDKNVIACLRLILEISNDVNEADDRPLALGNVTLPNGYRRNSLAFSGFTKTAVSSMAHTVWSRMLYLADVEAARMIECGSSVDVLNGVIAPIFKTGISSPVFARIRKHTINFIHKYPDIVFNDPTACTYKLVKNVVRKINKDKWIILDELWDEEVKMHSATHITTALFMVALYHQNIDVELFANSKLLPIAQRYSEIHSKLQNADKKDKNLHEHVADLWLEEANFFSPSPDCRVKVLLDLAQYHLDSQYFSEGAVGQLTAAALVAEYLGVRKKLPKNSFSDSNHPSRSFTGVCPSACSEECPEHLMKEMPKLRGFCTSKHFCECGLIFIIQTAMDTCKRASLFEMSTKIHTLVRPLAENRHLWKVLEKHFQNGAYAWTVLEAFSGKNDRTLGTYYRIQLQDGGSYIYRETQTLNLWQVGERLKQRLALFAQGKPVEVKTDRESLEDHTLEPDKYYIHVKAVKQFFTPAERKERRTPFEQNHNVNKFYFDLPISKSAQSSVEHCWLRRTIITIPHPFPYIVSRVLIPPENIETINYSPIEYNCQSLLEQIDKIKDSVKQCDIHSLQPLIQGSLLTQVNEGPKKMAEVFLAGGNENEHTIELRRLFRKFIAANQKAVKVHGEWTLKNPVYTTLQEELENGLNRLTSSLQPFLK